MTGFFTRLQSHSFAKESEYCGLVGRGANGHLRVTQPLQGNRDSCPLEWPRDMEVIASYHTMAPSISPIRTSCPRMWTC